jgi:surface carbohydrate biosynthesis protein
LYLYEYVARELDVACAVKAIAEQYYGLKIHIDQHPFGEMLSDLTRFRPRVVAIPHVTSSNIPYALEWPDATYVNLMWEQILYKGNFRAKMPRGEFALRHMLHHVWGEESADLLKEQGVPGAHVFVNGNPTYTLYQEPYRRLYERRDELARLYHLDPAKPWIFFPENYNWAFYNDVQLQSFIATGQTADEVHTMRDFCMSSFDEVMRWCEAAARRDNVEIVIRPRPGTPLADFRNAAQRALTRLPGHLHIIKDESVREWIINSDVVVTSYSTSLIEAAVAGKPAYILEPYPIPEFISMDWHNLTPHIKHGADFEALCQSANMLPPDPRLGDWARATMMANGDPIQGLADFFARLSKEQSPRPAPPPPQSLSLPPQFNLPPLFLFEYYKALRGYQRFRRKLQSVSVRPNPTHERELIGQAEIERRVERWRVLLADYQGSEHSFERQP